MTEDEAKTKVCQLRYIGALLISHRTREAERQQFCIGSACMMWRRYSFPVPVEQSELERAAGMTRHVEATGGYCGLAGKL